MQIKLPKRLIAVILVLAVLISGGIVYLNRVFLPTKIKSLIVKGIEDQTQNKVTLGDLKFSLFSGLVLKDLKLYDKDKAVIVLPQASCSFLIWPFFKKRIIIPHIKLVSPQVFLNRRADNTFNLQELFGAKKETGGTSGFAFEIFGISVAQGKIDFQDDTLTPSFTKQIDNINLALSLGLPASARFKLRAEIPSEPPAKINARGEFKFLSQQATVQLNLQDLATQELLPYLKTQGFIFPQGKIDALLKIDYRDDLLNLDIDAHSRDLVVLQGKVKGVVSGGLKAVLKHYIPDNQIRFSGTLDLEQGELSGIEKIEQIKNIKGLVKFDNSGFTCDNFSALVWDLPLSGKINLSDFSDPLLAANLNSDFDLAVLNSLLKDKFALNLPVALKGSAKLVLLAKTKIPVTGQPEFNGYLNVTDASAHLAKPELNLEKISGRLGFNSNQLKWEKLNFYCHDLPYQSSGTLTDFKNPGVQLELASRDLNLDTVFALNDKVINLSKCKGRFLNSEFCAAGNIDIALADAPKANINADIKFDLSDAKSVFKKSQGQLEKIKPQGVLNTQLNLSGNINDVKSCLVKATVLSPEISLYGMKGKDLALELSQSYGITDITNCHLAVYGGMLDGTASVNLNSANLPYTFNLIIQGLKLEELKLDTPAKGQDISGVLSGTAKINGFSDDLSKLSGSGKVVINEGRLWQLNLFKGMGALLFTSDFTNIVFNEGSCSFFIQNKVVSSNDLVLKSNLADLGGAVKIGFDGALDINLDVRVSEGAPLSGTFKDVTTAIIGQAGRFGTINITGTLKEPKYKFKTAVVDIIKGLTDVFLNNVKD